MLYWIDNIKYLRARKGLSQQGLADALGITRARYSKYEYGQAEPPLELVVKIARFYGVSIDVLLDDDISGYKGG
ncbi:helix-turn-helix domain-containing protein [Sphingobacterium bambusae]|uniref:Helix-turn-helix domain-containing protein n=1 Tax=Sphingobacterium bambusae TaxID=662858 RepID=A0ABW6BCI5_9SPHI|nr:helix-turn-helix transcriptional regulator [Sphingobacterium bambusae]WPL48462.1 helix-turn-helix transcriptional regulator [Sphingobacterium bambusae]